MSVQAECGRENSLFGGVGDVSIPEVSFAGYQSIGLVTAKPTKAQRALVVALAVLLISLTLFVWPHADKLGPELPGFVGVYQTAVAICDLLTAALLFSQFARHRTTNLLILSCGYLFTALMVTIHLASFPGVFLPTGVIGGDADTPPWLWTIWHSVFPITASFYAVLCRPIVSPPRMTMLLAVCTTMGAVVAAYVFAAMYNDVLPDMISDRKFSPFFLRTLYPLMTALCLLALFALLLKRTAQPLITLYLALAVLAFLLDVINNWHSEARYAVGWYLGRANSLVASVLLCLVFVIENTTLLMHANRYAESVSRLNDELNAANSAKSRFFAAASHDLRQPFQAMRLFFDTLAQSASVPQRKVIERLGEAMAGAESLLDELLDMARLEGGSLEPNLEQVDVGQIVAAIKAELEPVAVGKGITLRARWAEAWVRTDPAMLRRVLVNLVANAIRYTDQGGVLICLRRRAGKLFIEVWDTGIGIAKEETEYIFEEFYQVGNAARARKQGLGLGLAIVKRLSDKLGLEVSLASKFGRGSVFRVTIPV